MTSLGEPAHSISAKSESQEPVSKRHLSEMVCSHQVLFHSPYGNVSTFVLSGVAPLTGSGGKLVTLGTFSFACKPLPNSTEFYQLTKKSCKHRPYFSYEKNQELYHEGKMVCLLSEFLRMAMYQEGQRAVGEIPRFARTPSDRIKNLKPQ